MTKNEAKRAYLDRGILNKDVFERFLNEDPTPQKKYIFYMIKEYLRQSDDAGNKVSDLSMNDLDMGILSPIFSYVTEYNALLNRVPQDKKDIYKLSFDELVDIVDELNKSEGDGDRNSLRKKARENSDMLLNNVDGISVVAPYNHDAICYYGQGTKWCVSMDTSSHWMGYYFNQKNTFYIISVVGEEPKRKIKEHYNRKWESMGLGKPAWNSKKRKWVLVKNGKDVSEIAATDESEAGELFKQRLGLNSLSGYTIENYGYRNLYKVAFLIPPLKDKKGVIIRDADGNPEPDMDNVHIYSSDDISFNNSWKEYFKVIGLDKYI
jgi:hypothetical protein